ncbi:MAG: cupin domain-containing protein [Alphaproteobacteria bacterium]|nr:cupin domain-containing protein [Alphaproteobacteria bacterium]
MTKDTGSPARPISSETVPWYDWSEVPRHAVRFRHLTSAAIGGDYHVGVQIEELPPGKQTALAHYHIVEEEHVYVLEGAMTVRIGAASYEMKAGDYVCFPAGQKAGHCLINNSGAVCRYVVVGEDKPNEIVVFTDSNKVMVRPLGRRAIYDMAATRGYWDGENTGFANPADAPRLISPPPPTDPNPKAPISFDKIPWEPWSEGKRFGGQVKHLTMAVMGRDYHVGMLIEEVAPGRQSCPFHYHLLEEEQALVLAGHGTLRLGDQTYEMKAGDYVCFPAGQQAGHCFINNTSEPFRYLMIGERNPHEVCVYPDSNKVMVRALNRENDIFDMSATKNYYDGEDTG